MAQARRKSFLCRLFDRRRDHARGLEEGQALAILLPAASFSAVGTMVRDITSSGMETIANEVEQLSSGSTAAPARGRRRGLRAVLHRRPLLSEESVTSAIHWGLDDIPLIGGSAGDDLQFETTTLISDGVVASDSAIIVLVATDIPFHVFKTENFVPTGDKLVVTASDPDRRIVHEFNASRRRKSTPRRWASRPTLTPLSFASHPVVVRVGGEYYCRSIQKVHPDGSLSFFCAIDDGLVLSIAQPTGMVESTREALAGVSERLGGIDMILGFDCVLRRLDARNRQVSRDISELYRENNVDRLRHLWRAVPLDAPEPDFHRHRLRPSPGGGVDRWRSARSNDIEKLKKINAALISRVERSMDQQGNAFSLFQTAIALENRVRSRTEELRSTLRNLEQSNIELGAAKETAELANLSKTRFLAAASHDVLQPLNAAHLSISALAEIQTTDEGRTLVRQVERSLETMEDLLRTLLDISKLDAGVVHPEVVDVSLGQLFSSLKSDFEPLARQKGLRLQVARHRRGGAFRSHPAAPHPAEHPVERAALHAFRRRAGRRPPARRRHPGRDRRHRQRHSRGSARGRVRGIQPRLRPMPRWPAAAWGSALPSCAAWPARWPSGVLLVAGRARHGLPCRAAARRRAAIDTAGLRVWLERPRGYGLFGTSVLFVENDPAVREGMASLLGRWQCVVRAAASTAEAVATLQDEDWQPDIVIADQHLDHGDLGSVTIGARARPAWPQRAGAHHDCRSVGRAGRHRAGERHRDDAQAGQAGAAPGADGPPSGLIALKAGLLAEQLGIVELRDLDDRLGAAVDVELAQDFRDMRLHRRLADLQFVGDLLVQQALAQHLQDPQLLRRQLERRRTISARSALSASGGWPA